MERETKLLTWLEKEKNKDIQDLNREKQEIISQIKKLKKEDIEYLRNKMMASLKIPKALVNCSVK